VLVEDEALAEELERSHDQEEQVRGIAGLDDVESRSAEHAEHQPEGLGECGQVLEHLRGGATSGLPRAIAPHVDAAEIFAQRFGAFRGADHAHRVTSLDQRSSLLEDTSVVGDSGVLDQDEHASS
jgi:hypothetical protein